MDFYQELLNRDLTEIIDRIEYNRPQLINSNLIHKAIDDIIKNNKRVLVYGDYDPDGLCCTLCWKELFQAFNFCNYDICSYKERTHSLDRFAVQQAIEGRYDYFIVCDTGSNEIETLETLDYYDVKTILIDHHQTTNTYDNYPQTCSVVSSVIEKKLNKRLDLEVSAGALTFIILDEYLDSKKMDSSRMACFALVSLYADCIDMSNAINRGIYYKAMDLKYYGLPEYISLFLNQYTVFCRRFIEYHFTPKLNSVFRSEQFSLINDFMLSTKLQNSNIITKRIEILDKLHAISREMIDKVTDIIDYEILDNFVIGNLNSVNEHFNIEDYKLYNYTGLVANRLADRFGKASVVWCAYSDGIKGSFRDLLSRNYLALFKQFSRSNGHPAAFGIKIEPLEFIDFVDYIKRIDKKFYIEAIPNKPIIVDHLGSEPDKKLLYDMGLYNEFSGNNVPVAIIKKQIIGNIREFISPYGGYKYKWGDFYIQSPAKLRFGSFILLKPVIGKVLKLHAV